MSLKTAREMPLGLSVGVDIVHPATASNHPPVRVAVLTWINPSGFSTSHVLCEGNGRQNSWDCRPCLILYLA